MANCLNIVALSAGFSETASITKSKGDNVEDDMSVVLLTRDLISSDSVDVNLSFCTSFFNNWSTLVSLFESYYSTHEFNALFDRVRVFIHEQDVDFCIPRRYKSNSKSLLSVVDPFE